MEVRMKRLAAVFLVSLAFSCATPGSARAEGPVQYRVLATNKTSTMLKELNEAAAAGFRFGAVMGGETAFGGSEVVVVMQKVPGAARYEYQLLATSKTSTMQREIQQAADAGYLYKGQTVFKSMFGGSEVAIILERESGVTASKERHEYRLLATSKTSTMQKELDAAGAQSFEIVGMTVGETAMGGSELVSVLRRKAQ
jgi:hypothetical protein